MKCCNCGKEIPDESQFCNICGAEQIKEEQIKSEQSESPEQIATPVAKPKTKKKYIIGIVIVVIIIAIICIPKINQQVKYNKAITMIESGNFDDVWEGFEIFQSLKDKKKTDIYDYCRNRIAELCSEKEFGNADTFLQRIEHFELFDESESIELSNYIDYTEAQNFIDEGKYTTAYYQYIRLGDYEDSADKALELFENHKADFYKLAIENYEEGTEYDFVFAKAQFEKLGDYEESEEYLQKINVVQDFQGVYAGSYYKQGNRYFAVEGFKSYLYDSDGSIISKKDLIVNTYDNHYCMVEKLYKDGYNDNIVFAFMYNEDGQPQRYEVKVNPDNEIESVIQELQSKTDSEQFEEEFNRIPPAIGMTAEEVRKSTWGEPTKINKSTYSWGTSEQWVYSGYRYVYVENGIVTAIQE